MTIKLVAETMTCGGKVGDGVREVKRWRHGEVAEAGAGGGKEEV